MDAQFHKKKHYKLEAGFSCAPPGLNFLSDLYPGPRPGATMIPPRRLWLTGIKGGTLPLMRSVTYRGMLPSFFGVSLLFCSASLCRLSGVASSPAQRFYTQLNKLRVWRGTDIYGEFAISRHRNYTPDATNCGYGEVRICAESLLYPGTGIIHPTQQIAVTDMYGYIRRVCHIPTPILFTQRNKL